MTTKKADTLTDQQFDKLMSELLKTVRRPEVERVVFLLSYKAGLRAQEIAGLEWDRHLLDVDGKIKAEEYMVPGSKGRAKRMRRPVIWISSDIGKYGASRQIPMNKTLHKAIVDLQKMEYDGKFVIPSGYKRASSALKSRAHALTIRINRFYDHMEYSKCSSHSGRRTFITQASRKANYAGCSLVDVQQLAGHKQLTTTERYIDTTSQQADLIDLMS